MSALVRCPDCDREIRAVRGARCAGCVGRELAKQEAHDVLVGAIVLGVIATTAAGGLLGWCLP